MYAKETLITKITNEQLNTFTKPFPRWWWHSSCWWTIKDCSRWSCLRTTYAYTLETSYCYPADYQVSSVCLLPRSLLYRGQGEIQWILDNVMKTPCCLNLAQLCDLPEDATTMWIAEVGDLPEDRLIPDQPPFTSVGVNIFGLCDVITRKTRGSSANSKRWAALFTCLVTRAVHLELLEEMSLSSFINALRRYTVIRGEVKLFRSDRGTNFVGA